MGFNKLKLLRNYIGILLVLSILFSLNACRTKNIKTDYNETELRYISNEQIHFNSIPWTFKKIEFLPNGSIALDNVVVTKPDGSKLPLTPEGFLYSFVPDNQGVYCISYDYTYSNNFENVLPEDKSSLIWEKGAFTFNVKNYPIPEDYTYENVPWIPTKPYINREFMFEGDVVTAILRKVTYSNQDDLLYVDINYAELSAPEDNGKYLAFVRTVKDHFSAPSFYIESHSELCVFDKCTHKIERIPVEGIEELHLG